MITTAQKYNATISTMRALKEQGLEMPAFHHPFAKDRFLQNNSKTMKCLQDTHSVKMVKDLLCLAKGDRHPPQNECTGGNNSRSGCSKKATELLNQIENSWNPEKETPQRHDL